MMLKLLKRNFELRIKEFNFVLYNDGRCRIDDDKKMETMYCTGGDRIRWWDVFKIQAEKNKIDPNKIDGAFGAWVRLKY